MDSEIKFVDQQLIASLRGGEKSFRELRKISKISYSSLQRAMMRLMKNGALDRRWDGAAGKNRKYLYRLRDV